MEIKCAIPSFFNLSSREVRAEKIMKFCESKTVGGPGCYTFISTDMNRGKLILQYFVDDCIMLRLCLNRNIMSTIQIGDLYSLEDSSRVVRIFESEIQMYFEILGKLITEI